MGMTNNHEEAYNALEEDKNAITIYKSRLTIRMIDKLRNLPGKEKSSVKS